MKRNLFYFLALGSVLILSGCVARTYSVTRERIDQELSAGNRGYLIGKTPIDETSAPRKTERSIRIFEVEFGKPYQAKQAVNAPISQAPSETPADETSVSEDNIEIPAAEPAIVSGPSQKYTVGKNDTLQKISKKFYGTTKKWTKIYDANRDVLKGPNKVYPGQVLNIPDVSELKTPAENLK
ncbi:MAG: LysM peptidoglycan-binding domain-containing protein [Candidatus Omnitrophota bacterium]|nr:LysM peptidoglycan-binding domain-containing protein [Candidatus Omnitrophota bacterium]